GGGWLFSVPAGVEEPTRISFLRAESVPPGTSRWRQHGERKQVPRDERGERNQSGPGPVEPGLVAEPVEPGDPPPKLPPVQPLGRGVRLRGRVPGTRP